MNHSDYVEITIDIKHNKKRCTPTDPLLRRSNRAELRALLAY